MKDLSRDHYDSVAMLLHWAIAALILANIPLGAFSEQIEAGLEASAMWLHKSIGLTVLLLSLARLAWRLTHRPPPPVMEGWRGRLAGAVHWAFYALIILVPLTGWMRSSSSGYPLRWFELFDVPKFAIAPKSAEAAAVVTAHEWLAWTMAALIALHVSAALHHGWVRRDGVVRRMWPQAASG
ncbi:MAG: cytochrome b [Allosphingosinicella sp.]|uniref:cytochrome b n=1 Tax=Allosphingosinicella sp. TaxID=2823234 RepID=UPI00392C3115